MGILIIILGFEEIFLIYNWSFLIKNKFYEDEMCVFVEY